MSRPFILHNDYAEKIFIYILENNVFEKKNQSFNHETSSTITWKIFSSVIENLVTKTYPKFIKYRSFFSIKLKKNVNN